MRSVQTLRSTHPHRSRASPACVGGLAAATGASLSSSFCCFTHPLSCVPSLHGRYPLPRYYGRSDSRRAVLRATAAMNAALAPAGLPDYGRRDFRPFRLQPSARRPGARPDVRRFGSSPIARATGFATHSKARPPTPTESSSRRTALPEPSVLRTGRSRSVALHPASRRRSYGSIPHGSSPQGNGLSPFCLHALSGARARTFLSASGATGGWADRNVRAPARN